MRAYTHLRAVTPSAQYARAVEHSIFVSTDTANYGSAISRIVHALKTREDLPSLHPAASLISLHPKHIESQWMTDLRGGLEAEDQARKEGMMRKPVRGGLTKCMKCGSDDVFYYQKQTRSADEPMTVFYQCQADTCMHRWRR